ncbi:MAG: hypothetical protein GMKNLPBB_01633 [Myxococcota bacterium]|nr:hypothetical protein [Myxococcota bacterium]
MSDTRRPYIVSCSSHDSSATLMADGKLAGFMSDSRLSRVKYDRKYPYPYAVQYLKQIEPTARVLADQTHRYGHHYLHACSAFYTSPFKSALILTMDASGPALNDNEEWEYTTMTLSHGEEGVIHELKQQTMPHSLGVFYSTITGALGLGDNGEGKTMGLAPYGRASMYYEVMRDWFSPGPDGFPVMHERFIDDKVNNWMNEVKTRPEVEWELESHIGHCMMLHLIRETGARPEDFDWRSSFFKAADLAWAAQRILEEHVLETVRRALAETPSDNLCLAGGIFLNSAANFRILEKGLVKRLHIVPAAGDEGLSLGQALLSEFMWERPENGHAAARKENILHHAYHGRTYSEDEIRRVLDGYQASAIPVDFVTDRSPVAEVWLETSTDRFQTVERQSMTPAGPFAFRGLLKAAPGQEFSYRFRWLCEDGTEMLEDRGRKSKPGQGYSITGARLKFRRCDDIVDEVARRVAGGQITGWFQEGAEFGPRALGHRSILADPRRAEMKDILNLRVKHREVFRPFAPSVLAEYAAEYFDLDCPSPFMLLIAPVLKPDVIPAVTHSDGTARMQSVTEADNGVYHRLIRRFFELTGVPVILNTSFNVNNEPIVETPLDAVKCFVSTHMDALAMGPFIIEKE